MVEIRNVATDGNCFFRALYNAARDHGVLKSVAGCFQELADSSCWDEIKNKSVAAPVLIDGVLDERIRYNHQEEVFVRCMRKYIAMRIENDLDNYVVRTFRHWATLDNQTRSVAQQSFPDWMVAALTTTRGDEQRFRQKVARAVGTMGNWVDQQQVKLIRHVLDKCNFVNFRVVSWDGDVLTETNPRFLSQLRAENSELVLICEKEKHYYYVYQGTRRSPRSTALSRHVVSPSAIASRAGTSRGEVYPSSPERDETLLALFRVLKYIYRQHYYNLRDEAFSELLNGVETCMDKAMNNWCLASVKLCKAEMVRQSKHSVWDTSLKPIDAFNLIIQACDRSIQQFKVHNSMRPKSPVSVDAPSAFLGSSFQPTALGKRTYIVPSTSRSGGRRKATTGVRKASALPKKRG